MDIVRVRKDQLPQTAYGQTEAKPDLMMRHPSSLVSVMYNPGIHCFSLLRIEVTFSPKPRQPQ